MNASCSRTRTRSLVFEYEYHRKRLSTSTNARQIELTISGSFQAAARLNATNLWRSHVTIAVNYARNFDAILVTAEEQDIFSNAK